MDYTNLHSDQMLQKTSLLEDCGDVTCPLILHVVSSFLAEEGSLIHADAYDNRADGHMHENSVLLGTFCPLSDQKLVHGIFMHLRPCLKNS